MLLDALVRHLTALDTDQLAELLAKRPEVVSGVAPADLGEVAERLVHPYSLAAAVRQLPLPALQVLEAALALGDGCRVDELVALLDGGAEHASVLDGILAELHATAVILRTGPTLALPDTLRDLIPDPLGLGEPLAALLAGRTVNQLRPLATALGLPVQKNRPALVQALIGYYADPARVQALLADMPDDVRATLPVLHVEDWSDRAWRARQRATTWAGPRGLLIQDGYSHNWLVPSEVARALRGPDYAAPFAPAPPAIATRTVQPATVERESSAAATAFAAGVLALLDHVARTPVATLKSGGLGARELARLGKTLGTDEQALRLALELAQDCGLLDADGGTVTVADDFASWRDADPGEQFAALVRAWWSLGITPTEARDADDKVQRALVRPGLYCEGCVLARQGMLDVLHRLGATDRAALLEHLRWWHPGVHASPDDAPLADQWREAELLGVLADGAVSELGRALLAGPDTELTDVARRLLPATAQFATFGSDLTAFVAGTPAGRVTSVLDAAADREGRGGAITWRFSAASVRRAFDDGATADGLLAELAAVSHAELPQPLCYLVADVARRHGHLRLAPATAVVCSDDPALLALVAADRKLAKYGVRLLAPTVLGAAVDVDTLLKALRAAGYFPVLDAAVPALAPPAGEDPASAAAELRAAIKEWGRANGFVDDRVEPAPDEPPDLLELAGRLKAGRAPKAAAKGMTERMLGRLNRTLSTTELRQLAHAVDTGAPVGIVYAAASGGVTERIITEAELTGNTLAAWCELRSDDREFAVSRIRSVFPVG